MGKYIMTGDHNNRALYKVLLEHFSVLAAFLSALYLFSKLTFSSVNLSYVNLIMRPAVEPRRKEGNFFCPIDSYIGML